MLTWVHFGDIHASGEGDWESLRLLRRLTEEADRHLAWATDFASLSRDHVHSVGARHQRVPLSAQLGPNENGTIKW
jgi:cell division inhibitor SulA